MKTVYLIVLLLFHTILEAGKITWSEEGKASIAPSQHETEGCHMNDLIASLGDNNQTILPTEGNVTTLCT